VLLFTVGVAAVVSIRLPRRDDAGRRPTRRPEGSQGDRHLLSAVGYTVTAFTTSLSLVLTGWALVGFGVAMIGPQVYAAAGHLGGGRMLAVVVTFGHAAFLSGPAILGWLVHSVGVQHAMLLPLVLAFACRVLAFRGVA